MMSWLKTEEKMAIFFFKKRLSRKTKIKNHKSFYARECFYECFFYINKHMQNSVDASI
jgi:hypothetical protein